MPPTHLLHMVNFSHFGGAQRHFTSVVNDARFARNYRNDLLARDVSPELEPLIPRTVESRYRSSRLLGARLPRSPNLFRTWNAKRHAKRSDPDAIVAWNWQPAHDVYGSVTKSSSHPPLILMEKGGAWRAHGEHTDAYRRILNRAESVVCNSKAAERMLELVWGHYGNTTVCLNALDPRMGEGETRTLGTWKEPVLGFAGRMVDVKGVPVAIHALRVLRDEGLPCRLRLAGTGPRLEAYKRLAETTGVAGHCDFVGFVPDMQEFYDQIDLFICPSVRESFGRVSIEAAIRGCPVVAAGVDGLPETLLADVTGKVVDPTRPLSDYEQLGGQTETIPSLSYFPSEDRVGDPLVVDPKALAEAIAAIIHEKGAYSAFSAAGIAHTRKAFAFVKHLGQLSTIIDASTDSLPHP